MKLDFDVKYCRENNILNAKIVVSDTDDGWRLLEYADDTESWNNKGPHLFTLFCELRKYLHEKGKLLLCKGCRINVHPAGYQLKWIYAFVLTKGVQPDHIKDQVIIFDEELEIDQIVGVEEQDKFYREWWNSVTPRRFNI